MSAGVRDLARGSRRRWSALAAGFLVYFASGGLFNAATVFFKAIDADLQIGRGLLAGAFSVGFLAAGLAAPLWGRLADRRGPRAALVPGALLTGSFCVLLARADTALSLYTAYTALTLAAAGISLVPISVLIARWFENDRGRAMGLAFTGEGFGALLLTPLFGELIARWGWRQAYVVAGAGLICLLAPVVALLASVPEERLGRSAAPRGEREEGLTLRQALGTAPFWLVAAAWFTAMIPLSAVSLHQVAFLTDAGLPMRSASFAAGLVGGMGIAGRALFGWLAERWPIRWIYTACYLLMALGIALLDVVTSWAGPALAGYVVCFGVATGGAFSLAPLQVAHLFGVRALGEVFGVLGLAATVGGALGGAGAGVLYDRLGSYDQVLDLSVTLAVVASAVMACTERRQIS